MDNKDLRQGEELEEKFRQLKKVKSHSEENQKGGVENYDEKKKMRFNIFICLKCTLQEIKHKKIVHKMQVKYVKQGSQFLVNTQEDINTLRNRVYEGEDNKWGIKSVKLGLSGKVYKLEEFKDRNESFLEWNYNKVRSFRWEFNRKYTGNGDFDYEQLGYSLDDFIEMCDLDGGDSTSLGIFASDDGEGYKVDMYSRSCLQYQEVQGGCEVCDKIVNAINQEICVMQELHEQYYD